MPRGRSADAGGHRSSRGWLATCYQAWPEIGLILPQAAGESRAEKCPQLAGILDGVREATSPTFCCKYPGT